MNRFVKNGKANFDSLIEGNPKYSGQKKPKWILTSTEISGKVRLIQLLDYLSVASPESGLFSDWSRNKRYLEQNKTSVSLACY